MKNIFNSQMCIIQVSDFFFSFMLYDFSNDNVNIVSFFIYIYIYNFIAKKKLVTI